MKKVMVLLIPLMLLTVGCGNKKEEQFLNYAKMYYENHMKMIDNVDSVTITLDDLKSASAEDEYDLKRLDKCDISSKVTLYLDKSTKEIKSEKIDLKC